MRNRCIDVFSVFMIGVVVALAQSARGGTPIVETIDVGRGAVTVYLPSTYDQCEELPLIVALHTYTGNGPLQEWYFNLLSQIESRRFIYCIPDGTKDVQGDSFWNASDACCDFYNSGVDDSAYLRSLIDAVGAQYSVDDRSVHCIGLSNGGFMSYRMAFDHSDIIASVVVMAGAMDSDPPFGSEPFEPVSVLHIHGTSDGTVLYNGGSVGANGYTGAAESAAAWAAHDGCGLTTVVDPPIDLDGVIPGDETTRVRYSAQCIAGTEVALWTVHGGEHIIPIVNYSGGENAADNRLSPHAVDWMLAHAKPVLPKASDANGDGTVDVNDISYVLFRLGGPPPEGDANGDGAVDVNDISYVLFRLEGAC
jgi:polyhydroxybutyrate depolymerase